MAGSRAVSEALESGRAGTGRGNAGVQQQKEQGAKGEDRE